jgi:hypothetical protein
VSGLRQDKIEAGKSARIAVGCRTGGTGAAADAGKSSGVP